MSQSVEASTGMKLGQYRWGLLTVFSIVSLARSATEDVPCERPWKIIFFYGSSNVVPSATQTFFSVARYWRTRDKILPMKLFEENKTLSRLYVHHLMHKHYLYTFVRRAVDKVYLNNARACVTGSGTRTRASKL